MRVRPIAWIAALSALWLLLLPTLTLAAPPVHPSGQEGPNLLRNGDFEGGGVTWPFQDGIGEVQIAPGWRAYYLDRPPSYAVIPDKCWEEQKGKPPSFGCYWVRPEFRDVVAKSFANRVHGGERAQKYFSYGRMHEAGLMQQVTGIISGTRLLFSVYMEAWMCSNQEACQGGYRSDQPSTMHLRVGIDPTGGTNAFSPQIVWSREVDSFDTWTRYSIEAVAQSETVTVFTHSRPEWDWARMNNDMYVDDASLVALGIPEPSPTASEGGGPSVAAAQPAQPAQPKNEPPAFVTHPQSNQRPDGSLVHIVQANDTLFGMALAYGVTVDDIVRLNNIQPSDYLQLGQELIVKGPTKPAAPALATPVPVVAGTPRPTSVAARVGSAASGLCVQAFNDRSSNGLYDNTEDLVANVKFTVFSGGNSIATYTSTGMDEPHCFESLSPGAYTVRIEAPKNMAATTDEQVGVSLIGGQIANISFGTRMLSKSASPSSGAPTSNSLARSGGALVGIVGVGVLLAAGIASWVYISRKK